MAVNKNIPIKYLEHFIVIGLWIVIFALPLLILREQNYITWEKVFGSWQLIFPFFILFLLNHYLLVPYLLFKNRKLLYFGLVLMIIGLLFTNSLLKFRVDEHEIKAFGQRRMQPPTHLQFLPPEHGQMPPMNGQQPLPRQPSPLPPYYNTLLFSLFIFGFDTGLRTSLKWSESEKQKSNLEKENIENKLAFLKHQVSPHFFMNTLNNIHALVDIDTEEAKAAIIKLSTLMRYLLYDSEGQKVFLKDEVAFIKSYVNLMRLRFSEKVKIDVQISEPVPEKKIHPMLFVSLIENAFKHGISYQQESFVNIKLLFAENSLLCEIKNSKPKNVPTTRSSGIGMANTKKRLELLYGDSFVMYVKETENQYAVNLTIPL